MKVAFYAPLKPPDHPNPSGDRHIARLLIKALGARGYGVDLACRFRSRDPEGDRMRQQRMMLAGRWLADKIANRYRSAPPDLWMTYHLYYKAADWIGPTVSRDLGIPYCIVEASHAPKRADGAWNLAHSAVEQAIAQSALSICLNRVDVACLLPVAADPTSVHHFLPFIDEDPTPIDSDAKHRLGNQHGIDPTKPWLLVVAMMRQGDKLQSYRQLAQALSRVNGPFNLIVVGDGEASADVRAAFEGLPAVFAGRLTGASLRDVYDACDVYVWPAVNEAWGMVLLEAQARGLPVVAGDFGSVRDVVADGISGVVVPRNDIEAFAAIVSQLISDHALRSEMSVAAIKRINDLHGFEAAADNLDTLLRGVI